MLGKDLFQLPHSKSPNAFRLVDLRNIGNVHLLRKMKIGIQEVQLMRVGLDSLGNLRLLWRRIFVVFAISLGILSKLSFFLIRLGFFVCLIGSLFLFSFNLLFLSVISSRRVFNLLLSLFSRWILLNLWWFTFF